MDPPGRAAQTSCPTAHRPGARADEPQAARRRHHDARTRAYIQASTASESELARELGIHRRTVTRCKTRDTVADRSARPLRLTTTMIEWEQALILELRRSLALPLAHRRRFRDHAERDAYLLAFVADYNHTRLRCLGYRAPAELLANLAGHNTQAGPHYSDQLLKIQKCRALTNDGWVQIIDCPIGERV